MRGFARGLFVPGGGSAAPGGDGLTNIRVSAGALSALRSDLTLGDGNGISFGLETNGVITATVQTNYLTTAALSNHSHGNPTLALTNLTGTTASASNGLTLSLSAAAAQTVQTQNFIAAIVSGANGNGTFTSGTLSAKAGNNITLSTGANVFSIHGVAAQTVQTQNFVAVIASGANGDGTYTSGTLSIKAGNNVTISTGANVISIHGGAGAGGGIGDEVRGANGTATFTSGTITVGAGNNITLSTGANAWTIHGAAGGGGGFTDSMWWPFNEGQVVSGQQGQGTLHIAPVDRHGAVQFDRVAFPVIFSNATGSSGSLTVSMWMAIYTKNVSTLSILHSSSTTLGLTFSGTVRNSLMSGIRLLTMGWTTTVTEGQYYAAVVSRTTSGGANCSISQLLLSNFTNGTVGAFSGILGAASATSAQWPLGYGIYSATTSSLPNSIGFNQIRGTGTLDARPPSWLAISGTA